MLTVPAGDGADSDEENACEDDQMGEWTPFRP